MARAFHTRTVWKTPLRSVFYKKRNRGAQRLLRALRQRIPSRLKIVSIFELPYATSIPCKEYSVKIISAILLRLSHLAAFKWVLP